jgi:peptidoglycan/LPS O-acetylase OafA/YrhL
LRTAIHQNRSHYPVLDGLRGLAILLVVFYHNFGFINYFFFGWLGVDLFFVLSGFLITDILLKTRNSPNYLRNFYGRRILRIFPLYYLTLIIFFVLFPAFHFKPINFDYYLHNQSWFWLYIQNWLFIFYPGPSSATVLTHFWSLAVEEQFYLAWPFIILLLKRPKTILYLLIFLLLGVITLRFILWTYQIENLAYFNLYTFSRIDGICIGSMLAVLRTINPKAILRYFTLIVLGLAALNFLFYFFNSQNQFSFPYLAIVGYTTFAVIFGLLVNEGIEGQNVVINTIFSFPLLRFFGRISYSLYVFHWPIYIILAPVFQKWLMNNVKMNNAPMLSSIITTVIALILALISFQFFEKKFLSLKKNFE